LLADPALDAETELVTPSYDDGFPRLDEVIPARCDLALCRSVPAVALISPFRSAEALWSVELISANHS